MMKRLNEKQRIFLVKYLTVLKSYNPGDTFNYENLRIDRIKRILLYNEYGENDADVFNALRTHENYRDLMDSYYQRR